MNGWVERLRALGVFINQPGGVAVLVLAFLLAQGASWIPSTATTLARELREHDSRALTAEAQRISTDRRIIDVLERLTAEMERQNRALRFERCLRIVEPQLRRDCIQ